MKAVDSIKMALGLGDHFMSELEQMAEKPLTRPGAFGGNHPMWIVGHLAVAEGRVQKMLHGTPNPVEHWKPLFDWGSTPTDDASKYPPFKEVLGTYRALRAKTMAYVDQLTDADLDRPTPVPPPQLKGFETIGQMLMIFACHQSMHAGQGVVTCRAAGRTPTFEPSPELRAF